MHILNHDAKFEVQWHIQLQISFIVLLKQYLAKNIICTIETNTRYQKAPIKVKHTQSHIAIIIQYDKS